VLFIDARNIFTQLDRAHREFSPNQLLFIASLARLYRGEDLNGYQLDATDLGLVGEQVKLIETTFAKSTFTDVPGLCRAASRQEIAKQGWSMNPGRYVGVAVSDESGIDFLVYFKELNEKFEKLNSEARELEMRISKNIYLLLTKTL